MRGAQRWERVGRFGCFCCQFGGLRPVPNGGEMHTHMRSSILKRNHRYPHQQRKSANMTKLAYNYQ
jgi:hypothetical protein